MSSIDSQNLIWRYGRSDPESLTTFTTPFTTALKVNAYVEGMS
jgi:hypothetical protein